MNPSLRALVLFLVATSAMAGACGGNVVVDGATTSTGTGATTGSAGSDTGFGGSVTTGFGGGITTGFGGGITTGFGGGVTTTGFGGGITTTGFGGSVTTTTTVTTTGPCTDPSDLNIFQNTVAFPAEAKCALANLGNSPGLVMCLTGNVGLTSACAGCLADDMLCSVAHCAGQCGQDPESPGCASCRQANCEGQFVACSGLPRDTGITNCAGVLGQGPSMTPWQHGLADSDFTTPQAEEAYATYDTCVCVGCGPECAGNYCNGEPADAQCTGCVNSMCAMATTECLSN